jgi:hypothetical protein
MLNKYGAGRLAPYFKGESYGRLDNTIHSCNCWHYFILAFALTISFSANSAQLIRYSGVTSWYPTYESACSAFDNWLSDGTYAALNSTNCVRYHSGGDIYSTYTPSFQSGSCPSGYIENSSGFCELEPSCPVGEIDLGGGDCQAICNAGTPRTLFIPVYSATNQIITETGCTAQFNKADTNSCKTYQDTIYCVAEYIETDQFNETNPCDSYTPTGIQDGCYTTIGGTDDENPTGTINDTEGTEDLPKPTSTEQTSSTEPVTETNPDGSTTTTSTETTTKTLDSGTTIEQIGSTVVKKDSSGNIIEIVEQKTFNTYTDGTATETIEETTTATPSTVTKTTRDFTNNTTTTTTIKTGQSGSQTVTVTKNYNSSGQVTSSETTTTGTVSDTGTGDSGTGDVEGEGTPPFCEYADVVCDFIDWFKGDGTEEPVNPELPVDEIDVTEFESDWNSGLSTGTCPPPTTTNFNGQTIVRDYTETCDAVSNIFKPILLFLTMIACGYLLAGYRK